MKTYKNLYGKICSLDNLRSAFKKAKKGKPQMGYVKEFEAGLETNLLRLKHGLEDRAYEPEPLRLFVVRDPKTRLISAPHFRDRVVHHALCNIIEPIFDKTFIHDSYASRKGKGTHAALRRLDKFKRSVSCNGRLVNGAKDGNVVIGYALKCDIRHYFASVDHEALMSIIGRKVTDAKALLLISNILLGYDAAGKGKGMPIGSLTSQLFANIYLNELDYFVKHKLRAKYYIRYMDDFVLLHPSKEKLHAWKADIAWFLDGMKLELHHQKTNIFPLHCGVNFVGYRVFCHYKLLKKSNIRLMNSRMAEFKRLHDEGIMTHAKVAESLESWMSYARYADSYKTRRRIMRSFNHAFGVHFCLSRVK